MIIIGEKINGAIPSVGQAIEKRDEAFIAGLAKAQEEAGADYLDVCAGTSPGEEREALGWLIDIVQDTTALPICIDSPDAGTIQNMLPKLKRPGIINSISGEGAKCEALLPLLVGSGWQAILLCCDDKGVAADADAKTEIAFRLIEEASRYGVPPEQLHIDPLVLALSAANGSVLAFMEAVQRIKARYASVNVTAALSNVSFGMPARSLLNQHFLTLALSVGLDSGILDPLSKDVAATILATEALLGRDRHCRKYNSAFRAGKIGRRAAPVGGLEGCG